jgi:hypothetical protein
MLVHTILVTLPLVVAAAGNESQSTGSPSSASQATREKDDRTSLPGPSGAKDQGGAGANTGTEGAREDQTAAGEKGDTTSGAKSGRWDESGGKTAGQQAGPGGAGAPGDAEPRAHGGDFTVAGKLSEVSDDSITIQTGPGKSHTLKIVPQTKLTSGGKDARPSELEEGQEVRASYMEHGGEQIAVRVQASGGAAEPKREKTHNPRNNPEAAEKK